MSRNSRQTLDRFVARIEARSQAEKILVLGMLAAGLVMGFLTFVSDPLRAAQDGLERDIANTGRQIQAQRNAYNQKVAQSQEDPNRFANERLAEVMLEQERLDAEIARMAGGLVTPDNMTEILTVALQGQQELQLQQIQNLPAVPLRSVATNDITTEASTVQDIARSGNVYEHGIQLEFTGDFFSTLRYLKLLETLSASFFWDTITLQQTQWPSVTVQLRLHTLSTQEGFLGV